MSGISEIGSKNNLTQGPKSMPAFGSAYTPSFGNTTYHDEFVSSHDSGGVTAKQIGLYALIGAGIAAAVALAFRKPSATSVEAADAAGEVVERVVEYRLDERGWLKRLFCKTPEERIAAAEAKKVKIEKKAEIKAVKTAADAEKKAAKVEGKARVAEAEARLAAAKAGIVPTATTVASRPRPGSLSHLTGHASTDVKTRLAERALELSAKARDMREAYSEKHSGILGGAYRFFRYFGEESRDVKRVESAAKKAGKAAEAAGVSLKDLEGLKPEDLVEPLEPLTPAAKPSALAAATSPSAKAAPVAPAPVVPAPAPVKGTPAAVETKVVAPAETAVDATTTEAKDGLGK